MRGNKTTQQHPAMIIIILGIIIRIINWVPVEGMAIESVITVVTIVSLVEQIMIMMRTRMKKIMRTVH
jgi:hypothetical protein